MQYQKVIEKLGYSSKEAKVYMASLRLGEAHVSDIAKKVGLSRNGTQAILDKFQTDSLMSFFIVRRYKYWTVESPDRLLANLQKRSEAVREALPALADIRKTARIKAGKKNPKQGMGILRAWADSAGHPMLITNTEAKILYVNDAWEKEFGYGLVEVQGKNTRILSSGKTLKQVHQAMWESLENGKLFQTDHVIDKRKNGTYFSMQTTIFAVSHGDGNYFIQLLQPL